MDIAIISILTLVSLICFLGGFNILLKGAGKFLPAETPPQIVLDNLVRFLSGIYIGMGFLCVWSAIHVNQIGALVYFLGIIILCSGLGRLYSKIKMGTGTAYLQFVMVLEMVMGILLILLQYFR